MALLKEAIQQKAFDSRVAERNLNNGQITREDYEKFQADLPDDSDKATWVSLSELAKMKNPKKTSQNNEQQAESTPQGNA